MGQMAAKDQDPAPPPAAPTPPRPAVATASSPSSPTGPQTGTGPGTVATLRPTYSLEQVSCVVAVSNFQLRQILRTTLHKEGIGTIRDVGHIDDLKSIVLGERPDLVICDNDLNGGTPTQFIEDLRHGVIGDDPFPVITSLTGTPVADRVKSLVNAGVDDVISLPVPPRTVVQRAMLMIERRRPFVVTSDYTGPDRRSAARQQETPPGFLLDVPNTLRMKATGTYDPEVVDAAIAEMRDTINLRKVERQADRIVYGANLILPTLRDGLTTDPLRVQLRHLGHLARAIGSRIAGTRYAHVSDLCGTLHDVCDRLDAPAVDIKDVQVFEQLVAAVDRSFDTGADTRETEAARTITDTLREKNITS